MTRRFLALALLLSVPLPATAGEWALLNDGRVGRVSGSARAGPVKLTFADGKTQAVPRTAIRRVVNDVQAAAEVDSAVADLAARRNMAVAGRKLEALKRAAVPRLVHHLSSAKRRARMVALCSLFYCWSDVARKPLEGLLKDPDPEVRELAIGALARRLGPAELARVIGPLVEDKSFRVGLAAVSALEPRTSDLERIKKCLARPRLHGTLALYLPRYQSPELSPATLKLLDSPQAKVRRAAAAALVYQGARSEEVKKRFAALLAHRDPATRELAAEHFTWHGVGEDVRALKKAAAAEKDLWVLAALRAAVEAIDRRKGKAPAPPRKREAFEPVWRYEGGTAPAKFKIEREERLDVQARRLAIPLDNMMSDFEEESKAPPARTLMAPLRDYFNLARASYGRHVSKADKVFGNSVHVGDDVARYRDGLTVVSIGNGVVRRAGCTHSWGYMVIIEHRAPDGSKFCSLYAHLGPFVHVIPGDVVKKGQKIGTVGRSYTWENGGYGAHLHFGLHQGEFLKKYPVGSEVACTLGGKAVKGKVIKCGSLVAKIEAEVGGRKIRFGLRRRPLWIGGYIRPESFKAGRHGWVDPQNFIKAKMAKKK